MKKTKVYYNGKRLKDVYVGATRREVFKYRAVRFFRRLALLTMIFGSFWSAYQALQPDSIVYKVEAKEVVKEIQAPILDRIADCESGQRDKNGKGVQGSASQYGKSGQVLMTGNNDKTVDVGKYAINSVWYKKATELGYDLTTEKGNHDMAMWIYTNRGTGDWSASASCWKQ